MSTYCQVQLNTVSNKYIFIKGNKAGLRIKEVNFDNFLWLIFTYFCLIQPATNFYVWFATLIKRENRFQSFPPQYSICLERFLKMKTYKKTFNCQSLSHPRLCSLSYIFTFYIVIILMLQKLSRIKFLESCHWNCSAQIKIFVKKKIVMSCRTEADLSKCQNLPNV